MVTFNDFSEEQKKTAYDKLCNNIVNNELVLIRQNLEQQVDLFYGLSNALHNQNNSIQDYYGSPLGLVLSADHNTAEQILLALIDGIDVIGLQLHGGIYFWLAAKQGDEIAVCLARILFDKAVKLGVLLDLGFKINMRIYDREFVGNQDFLEVAIERKNYTFINWILQPQYMKSNILTVAMMHLHQAIKYFAKNILDLILINLEVSLMELQQGLEQEFCCISRKITYLEYLKEFHPEYYQAIGKLILTRSVTELDFKIFLWGLSKGFKIAPEHAWFVCSILPILEANNLLQDVLEVAVKFNDLQLLEQLLGSNKICILEVLKTLRKFKIQVDSSLNELFLPQILKNISEHNFSLLLNYVTLIDHSLYYNLWRQLILLPEQILIGLVDCLIYHNMKFFWLQAFLEFANQDELNILMKILQLFPDHKQYLLDGASYHTALTICVEKNNILMLKYLLPKLNARQVNKVINRNGYYGGVSALWLSIGLGFNEITELLLDHPEIKPSYTKGWHVNIKGGASLSCIELDQDGKFFKQSLCNTINPMPLYVYNNFTQKSLSQELIVSEDDNAELATSREYLSGSCYNINI